MSKLYRNTRSLPYERQPAPPLEIAEKLAQREFLFIKEVAELTGVSEESTLAIIYSFGLRPYKLEAKHGLTVDAYMTHQIKKMLAARGRIVPGFNAEEASQRQWLEVLEQAVVRPLDEKWYFQPVNPEPLITVTEKASKIILEKISKVFGMTGPDDEKLRLIADIINVEVREDMPLQANSRWKNFGKPGFRNIK